MPRSRVEIFQVITLAGRPGVTKQETGHAGNTLFMSIASPAYVIGPFCGLYWQFAICTWNLWNLLLSWFVCMREYVHTYPFSFENATFSLRIRLPFTRIKKRSMKTELFENALHRGTFQKRCFYVYVWTEENGTFRKRWGRTISFNPLGAILANIRNLFKMADGRFPVVFYTCTWAYF